jgi:hypothetical protein
MGRTEMCPDCLHPLNPGPCQWYDCRCGATPDHTSLQGLNESPRVAKLEKALESLLEWAEGSEQIWMADLPSRMAQELDGIVDLARAALRKDR